MLYVIVVSLTFREGI